MRKGTRIAAMLLSLSFVASFAACGGNPPDNGDGNGNGPAYTRYAGACCNVRRNACDHGGGGIAYADVYCDG